MKKKILFATAALLLAAPAIAQRNMNQKAFKTQSSSTYRAKMEMQQQAAPAELYNLDDYAYAESGGVRYYMKDNEMIFQVCALLNAKADRYLAVFNLTQVGETATAVDQLINSRIAAFTEGLAALGVQKKDVYVDQIYLIPTFEYEVAKKLFSKTYNEVPTGFEMQKNVHLSFTDINIVDDLVTLAAANEIYDLVKLDFFVGDNSAVYDTLRDRSVDYLNKKLASFKKLNTTLSDKYHTLREASYAIYPETQYSDYDAFVSQSIEAVKKKSGVTNIRKPKTVAYDQIPYNGFDIVINPAILQPVVQYTYTLQARYLLPEPDVKQKKSYMLVTPNGDVKPLPAE